MKKHVSGILAFALGLLLPPAGFLLAGSVSWQEFLAHPLFLTHYLFYVLPAICGAASLPLLQVFPRWKRILPLAAGYMWNAGAQLHLGRNSGMETDLFGMLYIPVAGTGFIIFLTSSFLLWNYIRTMVTQYRDIFSGKIPPSDRYEEK